MPKYLPLSVYSLSLSSVTYQHLLLLVGIDIIYRKSTIDPLELVGVGAVSGQGNPTKPINFTAISN